MGLLDVLQSDDPAIKQGLLQFGLGLLSSKGKNFGNAVGNAGLQGVLGAQQYRDRTAQQKRLGLQDQLTQGQLAAQKQQQADWQHQADLRALPGQFQTPAMKPESMDNRDVGMPGESQVMPGFDTGGYLNALRVKDYGEYRRTAKEMTGDPARQAEFSTTPNFDDQGNAFVLDKQGNKKLLGYKKPKEDKPEAEDPFVRLLRQSGIDPASEQGRRLLQQRVTKESTFAPPMQVNTYGSPVPVALPGGEVGYVQPGNRAGAAPMQMIGPDGKPYMKPKDEAVKAPSEAERTAGFLLQRVRDSQRQLATAETDDPKAAKPGLMQEATRRVAGDTAANVITPAARQRVEAAQMDMLDAALTLGTGAAYTKDQLRSYTRSYFPQIGDDPKTVTEKRERLGNLIRAAETKAGRASADKGAAATVRKFNPATGKIE